MVDSSVREPRSSVIIFAAVATADGPLESRVRNLSTTGACIDNLAGLTKGEITRLNIGTLTNLRATVMWADATRAGLRFDRSIDLAAARQPRERRAVVREGWMTEMRHAYARRA